MSSNMIDMGFRITSDINFHIKLHICKHPIGIYIY